MNNNYKKYNDMKNTVISKDVIDQMKEKVGLKDLNCSTIREIVGLVNNLEKVSGEKFIRMEMGVPGLTFTKSWYRSRNPSTS